MNNHDYCITNTIDKYSTIGNRYYHNLQNEERVNMRPRIPMRFDFNDVEIVKMSREDADFLRRRYRLTTTDKLFKLSRSFYSILNTILLYLLSTVLIIISVLNMKQVVKTLQTSNPSDQEKTRLGVAFIMSSIIVVFLTSYLSLSIFELYRNYHRFPTYKKGNFLYKNIGFPDGKARTIVLLFVFVCLLLSIAETINLFMMNETKSILLILIPATVGLLIIIQLTM